MHHSARRRVLILLQIIISGLALAYALRGINFSDLWSVFFHYSLMDIIGALLLLFLCCAVQAVRFARLFTPPLTNIAALGAVMIALGLNNILPAKGGELAKILYIHKHVGRSMATTISATFWERFLDANALYLLVVLILRPWMDPTLQKNMAIFFIIAWVCLCAMRLFPDVSHRLWRHLGALGRYGMPLRQLLLATITTSAVWISYGLYTVCALIFVARLPLTVEQGIIAFLILAAGQLIPSSPGSLGVFEASAVFGLGLFGVEKEPALAIALFMRAIQYAPTLVATAILLRLNFSR